MKKLDINLLSAAGTKRKLDVKASFTSIVIIVMVFVIGAFALMGFSLLSKRDSLRESNAAIELQLNNNTALQRLAALKVKEDLLAEIKDSVFSGNAIIKHTAKTPNLYPKITNIENTMVLNAISYNNADYVNITYQGTYAYIKVSIDEDFILDIYDISSSIVSDIRSLSIFKDVAIQEYDDGASEFIIIGSLKNVFELIQEEGVTIENYTLSGGVLSFNAWASSETDIMSYYMALESVGYFSSVSGYTTVEVTTATSSGTIITMYYIKNIKCTLPTS